MNRDHIPVLLLVVSLFAGAPGCRILGTEPPCPLAKDLMSGRPMYMHRAAHYLADYARGPELPSPYPHTLRGWQKVAEQRLSWLRSLDKPTLLRLRRKYTDEYLEIWCPSFGVSPMEEIRMIDKHKAYCFVLERLKAFPDSLEAGVLLFAIANKGIRDYPEVMPYVAHYLKDGSYGSHGCSVYDCAAVVMQEVSGLDFGAKLRIDSYSDFKPVEKARAWWEKNRSKYEPGKQ